MIGFAAAIIFAFVVVPLSASGSFAVLSSNTAYRTWQVLVALQASLWIFGTVATINMWRATPSTGRLPLSSNAAIFLLSILVVLPYLIAAKFPPPATGFDWSQSEVLPRGSLVSVFGVLATIIVGAGIIRIHVLVKDWLPGFRENLNDYRAVSSYLERHLLLLGSILAGAVIGTNALREALFSVDRSYPFPTEQVWQLSIYWSALLAVVYVAARVSVRRVGFQLRDILLRTPITVRDDTDRLEEEEKISKFLGLNRGYLAELQSVFSILAPIAGAIVSQLAPSG